MSSSAVAPTCITGIRMLVAKIEGLVVATIKDGHVDGRKLLLVRPQFMDGDPPRFVAGKDVIVAVDSVGAGIGELVVVSQGSAARFAPDLKEAPIDAVIIGIVDVVDMLGHEVYSSKT